MDPQGKQHVAVSVKGCKELIPSVEEKGICPKRRTCRSGSRREALTILLEKLEFMMDEKYLKVRKASYSASLV